MPHVRTIEVLACDIVFADPGFCTTNRFAGLIQQEGQSEFPGPFLTFASSGTKST